MLLSYKMETCFLSLTDKTGVLKFSTRNKKSMIIVEFNVYCRTIITITIIIYVRVII